MLRSGVRGGDRGRFRLAQVRAHMNIGQDRNEPQEICPIARNGVCLRHSRRRVQRSI